jgi:hypothetical protein
LSAGKSNVSDTAVMAKKTPEINRELENSNIRRRLSVWMIYNQRKKPEVKQ